MYIVIKGRPIRDRRKRNAPGQKRPYDCQKAEKRLFKNRARPQITEFFKKGVPLAATFKFCFKRPKEHYRTGKYSHLLKDDAPKYPCTSSTADLSNLIKFAEDCLNKIAYHDDCQIVRYIKQPELIYDEWERTEILIEQLT